jgi:hypothetical protein
MKSPNRSSNTSENAEAKSALPPPPGPEAHAAVLEGRVAEPVVGRLLLGILQDVIGLVDLLELAPRASVVPVAVGMKLHRELAVGLLDVIVEAPSATPSRS